MGILNAISTGLMGVAVALPPILASGYKKLKIFLVGVCIFLIIYAPLAIKVFFFSPDEGGYNSDLSIWQLLIIGVVKIFLGFLVGCVIMAIKKRGNQESIED